MPHGDHLVNILAKDPENKKKSTLIFNLTPMLLMIFYVKTCIEFLQELLYMTYWKVTDKILTGTVFLKFCLSLVGWADFESFIY